MKRRTGPRACARCGVLGHNRISCTAPTISSPVMAAVAIAAAGQNSVMGAARTFGVNHHLMFQAARLHVRDLRRRTQEIVDGMAAHEPAVAS